MTIKVYSTPTCPYCIQAKDYFKKNNIVFEDIDVSSDTKSAEEMVKISGQMGVPVITMGDQVIIGFDEPRIAKILKS